MTTLYWIVLTCAGTKNISDRFFFYTQNTDFRSISAPERCCTASRLQAVPFWIVERLREIAEREKTGANERRGAWGEA